MDVLWSVLCSSLLLQLAPFLCHYPLPPGNATWAWHNLRLTETQQHSCIMGRVVMNGEEDVVHACPIIKCVNINVIGRPALTQNPKYGHKRSNLRGEWPILRIPHAYWVQFTLKRQMQTSQPGNKMKATITDQQYNASTRLAMKQIAL